MKQYRLKTNPNRNNSWFTRESMERSIDTFVNKQILGYFENGDFVSHNGEWGYDSETELDYWDTLGTKGERILGIIRESDTIKIVDGEDGLSWITLTCALWTQYSFKQVKRLIKDAKRAQKTGKSTKNISVEVDITDYEELPNGVMKINEFNLVGVTILGSRNGVPVEPGIENAELSVVDIMGRELYSKQEQSLRLAYEKLNKPAAETQEVQQVNEEEKVVEIPEDQTQHLEESPKAPEDECKLSEEVCPDCGKAPCECEKNAEQEACGGEDKECKASAEEGKDEDDDQEDDPEEEKKDDECKLECKLSEESQEEYSMVEEQPVKTDDDVLYDAAWLLSSCGWNVTDVSTAIEYYEGSNVTDKDYVIGVLSRIKNRILSNMADLGDLVKNIAVGISEDMRNKESQLEQYDGKDILELVGAYNAENAALSAKYEQCVAEKDAAVAKVAEYEHQLFVASAIDMIKSVEMDEADARAFEEKCAKSEITTLEDLKTQLALYVFEHREIKESQPEHAAFTAPVAGPDSTAWCKPTAATKTTADHWSTLRDYVGK